jgi:phosphoribosylpyrophosphate synthetase
MTLPNLTVLSIAPLLAGTIEAIFEDRSVSELFQGENT